MARRKKVVFSPFGNPPTRARTRNRCLFCVALTILTPAITLAKLPGDPALQATVAMAITSDGVFVIGREGLVDSDFWNYLRSAFEAFRQNERISVDIDYCSDLPPEHFCDSERDAPQPTDREKNVLGEVQFMTVGYGGAYRQASGWCLKTVDDCVPIDQPPSYYNKSLGALLFEIDYWLKTWVIGKNPATNRIPASELTWLKPLKEYIADAILAGETSGNGRTWFRVLDSTTYKLERSLLSGEDTAGYWFRPIEIPLCIADESALTCGDSLTDITAIGTFASSINSENRLSELGERYSVIAQMVQAAHAVVIAKWLSEYQPDIEFDGPSESTTPPRTRVKMRLVESDRVKFTNFSGGVVMDPTVSVITIKEEDDDGTFESIADAFSQREESESVWTARLERGGTKVRVLRVGG